MHCARVARDVRLLVAILPMSTRGRGVTVVHLSIDTPGVSDVGDAVRFGCVGYWRVGMRRGSGCNVVSGPNGMSCAGTTDIAWQT